MKSVRLIGNFVSKLINEHKESKLDLINLLDCSGEQFERFLKGRFILSYDKLLKISNYFKIDISDLLKGDEVYYDNNFVHCEGGFENSDNKEEILDIIDDYLLLLSDNI